ncbi:transcription factor 7-like 1 [Thalassophryne amazonica]|uniref:transcription factor 7-like 1 n=1 Tax=Thalassophryne amazonica TaxID=390379 RepID=UPI001472139B|nr:transcription factor 7-like 1 [Thalassophryne amazonica]
MLDDILLGFIQMKEEAEFMKNSVLEDPYVDTTLEDWFQRYLDQESSPPAPPEEAQDLYDSFIPDFVCPEDTDGPLEVPPDSPLLPTYSVPPVVPPYTDAPPTCESPPPNPVSPSFIPTITNAPPTCEAPPPNPPLPPSFIPTITDTPPTCEAPPPNPPLPPSFIPTITDAPPPVRPRTPSPPRPHIKKPPNSFMLFRQEQRPLVAAQNNITDCAAINKILGQMWKSLSEPEKEKYRRQQKELSERHYELHPDWMPTSTKRKADGQTRTEEPKKQRKKRKQAEETKRKDDDDDCHTVQISVRIPTKSFCAFWEEQRSRAPEQDSFQNDHHKKMEQMWDSLTVQERHVFYRLGHGLAVRKVGSERTS